MNVYEAAMSRIRQVFAEFDNVYVSFSGGKDSGVLLNLVLKFLRTEGGGRRVGVFHQDFEAQYTRTTEYVEREMTENLDVVDPYWVCLPMQCKTATSMFEQYWAPWDPGKKDLWVRDMPTHKGVINLENHCFQWYDPDILQEDLYGKFAPWLHKEKAAKRTACLVGIRTQESLNRWRAIQGEKSTYKGLKWTTQQSQSANVYNCYPIYDWSVEDIWVANGRFGFDYNRVYDLFYYAGLSVHQMRVASPFNDWAIGSLKLYRVLEPGVWAKMVGRVNGANFCAIYGGTDVMAWKNIKCPPGHSWKTFLAFLLSTLPKETREQYDAKFATSIRFWRERGGVLSAETIAELNTLGITCETGEQTSYKTDKLAVRFEEYPDDADVKEFQSVPSYKRMCICVLKNDHGCKYMGFGPTKLQQAKRRAALAKFSDL